MYQIGFWPMLSVQEAVQPFICSCASMALGRKRRNLEPVARAGHPGTRVVLNHAPWVLCFLLLSIT